MDETLMSKRIREARKLVPKRTTDQFGLLIGATGGAVRNWECGVKPSEDNLAAIAKATGTTVEWLRTGRGEPPKRPEPDAPAPPALSSARVTIANDDTLPVIATEDNGEGNMIVRKDSVIERIRRPDVLAERPEAYALFVSSETMSPAFRPGDTIWVDPMLPVIRDAEVIITKETNDDDPVALLGTLTDYDRKTWTVDVLKPPKRLTLKRSEWLHCHRIVGKTARR